MNKAILVGNLTRDPEITTTATGVSICKFSIAINRNFTNAAGEREADFLNIVAWRELGENCGKFLSKGKKVAVCGSIQTRSYETDNGEKRYVTEIIAQDVEFLSPKNDLDEAPVPQKKKPSELKPIEDDGLPF